MRIVTGLLISAALLLRAHADDVNLTKQVFGQKIIMEMTAALTCQMAQELDKQRISALEQRIADLEAKYEPKPRPDALK